MQENGRLLCRILEKDIASLLNSLQTIAEHPIEPDQFPKTDANQLEVMKQQRLDDMKSLQGEIDVLTSWKNKLKPYLIKSMEAKPRGIFGATLLGDTLLIVSGPITAERPCNGDARWWFFCRLSPKRFTRRSTLHCSPAMPTKSCVRPKSTGKFPGIWACGMSPAGVNFPAVLPLDPQSRSPRRLRADPESPPK